MKKQKQEKLRARFLRWLIPKLLPEYHLRHRPKRKAKKEEGGNKGDFQNADGGILVIDPKKEVI